MTVNLEMRVLVVEDTRTMAKILRNLLKLIGFMHVDAVFDGATALRMLRANKYGLVISDWNMQPMTGQMLLEQIRADPGLESLPFIVVTADTRLAPVQTAKEAGASGYVIKPFSGETLKQKIVAAASNTANSTSLLVA